MASLSRHPVLVNSFEREFSMKQRPCIVAVSGIKNTGKTRLIERLLPELTAQGLCPAVIKHDGHRFEPDRPGTDSYRYLSAGAVGTAVFDGEKYQLVRKAPVDEAALIAQFPEADLILLEGFKYSDYPKLELLRAVVSEKPVCHPAARLAFVTDTQAPEPGFPVFSPDDTQALAAFLAEYAVCSEGFSAVLLAGGRSSRMGSPKAELPFGGMRMIDYQVRRLRMLGIEDIVAAGFEGSVPGARIVPDERPHLGPVGGLKSGLEAAKNEKCLVLSVDAPLIPFAVFFELMRRHRTGISVVEHGGQLEPLIGIYDRSLTGACAALLAGQRASVRQLFEKCPFQSLRFETAPLLLSNCNTPEEYAHMCAFFDGKDT